MSLIIILGLIVFAAVVAVAGVLGNAGSDHQLTHGFAVFGYHVTGSAGMLFLAGIAVGIVGLFGLILLLAGARRTVRQAATTQAESPNGPPAPERPR